MGLGAKPTDVSCCLVYSSIDNLIFFVLLTFRQADWGNFSPIVLITKRSGADVDLVVLDLYSTTAGVDAGLYNQNKTNIVNIVSYLLFFFFFYTFLLFTLG